MVPLFVSEGTMRQKVASIQNSYYLSTVYREVLTAPRKTLTLFGWGLGEHDRHLLKRMKGTGIERVAVSVFRGYQPYCNMAYQIIQDDLGPVDVDFFDSEPGLLGSTRIAGRTSTPEISEVAVRPVITGLDSFILWRICPSQRFWGSRQFCVYPNRAEGHGNWASLRQF